MPRSSAGRQASAAAAGRAPPGSDAGWVAGWGIEEHAAIRSYPRSCGTSPAPTATDAVVNRLAPAATRSLYRYAIMLCAVTTRLLLGAFAMQDTLSTALRSYLLYSTPPGRFLMRLPPTWWLLGLQHKHLAQHANSPDSRKEIPSFVKVGGWVLLVAGATYLVMACWVIAML